MSGSRLPPLKPLAGDLSRPRAAIAATATADDLEADLALASDPSPPAVPQLPWERGAEAKEIETQLKAFCRAGELVYAAVVSRHGAIRYSVCMVGSCPHNEGRIGELVIKVFSAAELLGGEVGEREPQALNLQGARWSYSLEPLSDRHLLFGIYSSKALPAIVRACAQKASPALVEALSASHTSK